MPKGRVEPRECICRACAVPFITDKVGKAAFLCHRTECDEARERERKAGSERRARQRQNETEARRRQREDDRRQQREQRVQDREERERQRLQEREDAKAERERQQYLARIRRHARRIEEREERARQRKAERIATARRKALEKKARKKGLEIFAPIMDDPDSMLLIADILEISKLASELRGPTWVDLRKAVTRVASAKPDGREASHEALKHLSAVAMRMADLTRTHATRDPNPEASEPEPELVAA